MRPKNEPVTFHLHRNLYKQCVLPILIIKCNDQQLEYFGKPFLQVWPVNQRMHVTLSTVTDKIVRGMKDNSLKNISLVPSREQIQTTPKHYRANSAQITKNKNNPGITRPYKAGELLRKIIFIPRTTCEVYCCSSAESDWYSL